MPGCPCHWLRAWLEPNILDTGYVCNIAYMPLAERVEWRTKKPEFTGPTLARHFLQAEHEQKAGQWILFQRYLIISRDEWTKCLSDKNKSLGVGIRSQFARRRWWQGQWGGYEHCGTKQERNDGNTAKVAVRSFVAALTDGTKTRWMLQTTHGHGGRAGSQPILDDWNQ